MVFDHFMDSMSSQQIFFFNRMLPSVSSCFTWTSFPPGKNLKHYICVDSLRIRGKVNQAQWLLFLFELHIYTQLWFLIMASVHYGNVNKFILFLFSSLLWHSIWHSHMGCACYIQVDLIEKCSLRVRKMWCLLSLSPENEWEKVSSKLTACFL